MKCLRLTHVNLRVDRLEPALLFYGKTLGLEPIPRGEREGLGAWFRVGDSELHLTEDDTPQPASKRHFAIEVDDLAAARKAVTAGGGAIEKEEEGRRFWTRDPSGNRIEIAQAAAR
jgi:catechol 2,3-dioxygenase-like lactoylglutathione lyase family enzyme